MQNFDILGWYGLFFLNTPLRVTKQGIDSSFCLVLLIIDPEVVAKKLLGPADLFGAQTVCVHELAEVVVVGEYEQLMLRLF